MEKKKFKVDVYRTLAQTIEIEAEDSDDAYHRAMRMLMNDEVQWNLDMGNGECDAEVIAEYNDAEKSFQYYSYINTSL